MGMEVRMGRQDGNGVRLQQANRDVAVPMLVSPQRYGILWNDAAVTGVEVDLHSGPPVLIRSKAGGGDARYDFRNARSSHPARRDRASRRRRQDRLRRQGGVRAAAALRRLTRRQRARLPARSRARRRARALARRSSSAGTMARPHSSSASGTVAT